MIAYVLDKVQNPITMGVSGEIYLFGTQVTTGYFNLEVKTKAFFLPDLYCSGEIIYQTGN